MKNFFIYILIFSSFFLVSCLGTKTVVENSEKIKQSEKVEISTDTIQKETVNRAIDDEFLLSLRTSDSITNEVIRKALEGFEAQKSSGSNTSSIYFDYERLAFVLRNTVGETKDTELSTSKEEKTEKSTEVLIKEYTKKVVKMIPWWVWAVVAFIALPHILKLFTANPLFIGARMATKGVQNIIKKRQG